MEAGKVPFTVEDLYDLDWLEDPQLSPDGRFVAYVHVRVDRLRNSYRRNIWIAATDGSTPKRFTSGSKSDSAPRWSPDGTRLAFVSNREDAKGQIYIIDLVGGEAQQLTAVLNGASAPAWSADGTRIAFLSRANEAEQAAEDSDEQPEPPRDEWEAKRRSEQRAHEEAQKSDPLIVTKLPYRSGTTFFDDRRSHIYVIDVPAGTIEKPGQAKRVTSGDLHYGAPEWEPHGNSLLTTATRDPEADSLFGYYDVVRVYFDGRTPEVLTSAGHSYFNVRPSPDGKHIAFTRKPDEKLL
jgi:Tol biopolymer transport system component